MITSGYFESCKITPKTKTVFVSHNDLDGAGPIIIGKNYFEDCKYFTVSNGAVDKIVKMVLTSPAFADRELILITDVSVVDQSVIQMISNANNLGMRRVMLFDHHGTAINLNEYDWAHVTEVKYISGTKLFWDYIQADVFRSMKNIRGRFRKLDNLVNKINDWDTWKWKDITNDDIPRQLSELFAKTGVNYFLSKYVGLTLDRYFEYELFNDADRALTADFNIKEQYIIWPGILKSARLVKIPINGENKIVKCISISDNPGDRAEQLYEEGVDFVFMFYPNVISIRTRLEDIDLGSWAKSMGGGGHRRSAGFPINGDTRWVMDMYLDVKFN